MDGAEESLAQLFKELETRLHAPQYDVAPIARIVESSIQALMQVKIALNKQQSRFEEDREELLRIAKLLQNREERLLAKELELKNQEKKIGDVVMVSQDKIDLNVGGKIITTSKQTLVANQDTMLAAMFSGRHRIPTDSEGRYFIDRDPTYFHLVLNYLREGKIRLPPSEEKNEDGISTRSLILDEFDYFCIPLKGVIKSTNFVNSRSFIAHDDKIRTLKVHGTTCVSGGDDGYIKFFDLNDGRNTFEFNNPGNVERIDYNGTLLAAAIRDEEKEEYLKLWKMSNKECVIDKNITSPIYWLQIRPKHLITAGYQITTYDLETWQLAQQFGKKEGLISWCMDSEENVVATGQNDGSLAVWDLRASQSTSIIQGAHGEGINELKIHNGEIITASSDTTVKIFDIRTLKCRKILDAHLKSVFGIAVVENMVVSASCDKTVRLWDMDTGECQKTLYGHKRAVSCVGVCGDDMIVSGAWDGNMMFWAAQ